MNTIQKKAVLLFLFTILFSLSANAQSVAINTDGTTAHPSAILDLKSTNQGVLVPRLTASQRTTIASPATGLMVYQTDGTAGFYFYNGTAWTSLNGTPGATGPQGPAGTNGNDGATGATGAQGPQGIQGLTGATGTQGTAGTNGTNGLKSLVKTTAETAGTNCANGGTKVETGIDTNNDNTLQASEVTATNYVCNGATGAQGTQGATGATGTAGTNGQGVPTGGTTGQVLAKTNATDYNTTWVTPASGSADNLGNHTATQALNMSNYNITNVNTITSNKLAITKADVNITSILNPGTGSILSTDIPITNTASFIKITGLPGATTGNPHTLQGFQGGFDGRILYVYNATLNNINLLNNSANEPNGVRIALLSTAPATTQAVLYTFIYDASQFSGNGGWVLVSVRD